jgi:hypothetical protein
MEVSSFFPLASKSSSPLKWIAAHYHFKYVLFQVKILWYQSERDFPSNIAVSETSSV